MHFVTNLVSFLLGLFFLAVSGMVLLGYAPAPELPAGSPQEHFFQAVGGGYMTLIKSLEATAGLFLLVPALRNLGLLILGPILVNILAYHHFVAQDGVMQPLVLAPCGMALFLLLCERRAWVRLLTR